ncbi:hypothetical protein BKA70DRAFT_1513986 [Coprinopsis sp. MPI-PUGE-AT-0042]|nr:hypothetical protein BKA70DRAFT_1513986 [Coprinopsis sp. MPI-PUGE-AT-0042]
MSATFTRRIRGGAGTLDASSDEEDAIDFTAVIDSQTGQRTQAYTQFSTTGSLLHGSLDLLSVSKSLNDESVLDPSASGTDTTPSKGTTLPGTSEDPESQELLGEPAEVKVEQGKKSQGASVKMKAFTDQLQDLQNAIFFSESHPGLGSSCSCGTSADVHFSCKDCFQAPLSCESCMLRDHKHQIYHRLSRWNGKFFEPYTLHEAGLAIQLGHHGLKCHNESATSQGRSFVLVHTNGMHGARVHFCHCPDAPSEVVQLMQAKLFPATTVKPETAFSFDVLNDFHVHTLTSKKSAHDYHNALQRFSDAAFPQKTPSRYYEFLRVSRVWRHLACLRRSGQSFEIDDLLTSRKFSSVIVRCPACPEVGFNVEKAEIELAGEDEKHIYTLFISADGNYRLQRKAKNSDEDDVALNNGRGCFVETGKYKEYLDTVDECDTGCTCAHLRAVRLQNIIKFKNAVISGVISVQCARHGFYLPRGTADLVRGEPFCRTDYTVYEALHDQTDLRWIMLCYDIWCSYSVNLKKRFREMFGDEAVELIEKMRGAVPKMHIKNHIVACQQLWAFNYLVHSGETYGEMIETSWAEANQAGGSTKEMNDGNRHDTLDDLFSAWNWDKFRTLPETIYNSYTKVLDQLKQREKRFDNFSERFSNEDLEEWKKIPVTPYKDKNGNVVSPFEVHLKNAPPTEAKAYQRLVEDEHVKLLAGQGQMGDAALISLGLELEEEQARIKLTVKDPTVAPAKLKSDRQKYSNRLTKWFKQHAARCPKLYEELSPINSSAPEETAIKLPSQYMAHMRAVHDLTSLAETEYQLREGQAHDALEKLRFCIQVYHHNVRFKKDHVFGQRANTRAQVYLMTLAHDRDQAAEKYRRVRKALLRLGLSPEDTTFRALNEKDESFDATKNASRASRLGDSKKEDPWFWDVGRPSNLSKEDKKAWMREMDRVKWFRDRAIRDRGREEKEILEAEMRRVVISHTRYRDSWKSLAQSPQHSGVTGKSAYAWKQSFMYDKFLEDAQRYSTRLQDKKSGFAEWYSTRASE